MLAPRFTGCLTGVYWRSLAPLLEVVPRFGRHAVMVWARLRTGTGTVTRATRTTSASCRTLPRCGARACQSAQSCRTWPPRRQKGVSKPQMHGLHQPRSSSDFMFDAVRQVILHSFTLQQCSLLVCSRGRPGNVGRSRAAMAAAAAAFSGVRGALRPLAYCLGTSTISSPVALLILPHLAPACMHELIGSRNMQTPGVSQLHDIPKLHQVLQFIKCRTAAGHRRPVACWEQPWGRMVAPQQTRPTWRLHITQKRCRHRCRPCHAWSQTSKRTCCSTML